MLKLQADEKRWSCYATLSPSVDDSGNKFNKMGEHLGCVCQIQLIDLNILEYGPLILRQRTFESDERMTRRMT